VSAGAERRDRRDDAGITLIEVVVAMSIMTIFMAMFTAAIVQVYRVANSVDAAATAQSQVHITFLRLDTQIRYADGISTPARIGTDSYVEYLTTNTSVATCTQLRLRAPAGAPAQLQQRSWPLASPPAGLDDANRPWRPLASGVSRVVVGGTPQEPFTLLPATAPFTFPRLHLAVAVDTGSGRTAARRETNLIFTARNARASGSEVDTCAAERPTS
jgi:hypothetical protein